MSTTAEASEIEITQEMIEAGVCARADHCEHWSSTEEMVSAIYRAMAIRTRPSAVRAGRQEEVRKTPEQS
jgi:hypothetical protein